MLTDDVRALVIAPAATVGPRNPPPRPRQEVIPRRRTVNVSDSLALRWLEPLPRQKLFRGRGAQKYARVTSTTRWGISDEIVRVVCS